MYVYNKNSFNNDKAFTKKGVDEYLELYKNFKLKIQEAKYLKLDTLQELLSEFESYREQLRKPYLSDGKIKETLIQEAYDRYKTEVKASHILLSLPSNPSPEDTLAVWNKIIEIRDRVLKGEDFGKLAGEYSGDPSAKVNGGDLGYFSSMQMVYPFETMAYNTAVGEISLPVRTRFGYHIIKVIDKIPARGKVRVSHIMLRNLGDSTSQNNRNKIFEIFDRIQSGLNWTEAISLLSEDNSSKSKANLIDREFTPAQLPPTFSDAAFSLRAPGDISDPFETQYGWHILRLEQKVEIESFEEMESVIRRRISSDQRADIERNVMIAKLKRENDFTENPGTTKLVLTPDSLELIKHKNEVVFSLKSSEYTVGDYLNFRQKAGMSSDDIDSYENFVNQSVIEYEESHLAEKYPEYKHLVNEYWEGILLFKLMDDQVWSKAADDSLGLSKYYQQHIEKFQWDKRIVCKIYSSSDADVKASLKSHIESQKSDSDIKNLFKSDIALKIDSGAFEMRENEILKQIDWSVGTPKA